MDKIDNESVESSNCDSLRIDNSPSDDIEISVGGGRSLLVYGNCRRCI